MHFLSHFYVEQPQTNPYFVAALGIPDLTPRFSRIYNLFVKNSVIQPEKDLEQVRLGILHHYAADKRFHNGQPFLDAVSGITNEFVKQGLNRDRLRLSVIAHLAVEMMIDRQILLQKELICTEFYKVLEGASEGILGSFFDQYGLEAEKRIFLTKFQFFKQRQFLFLFRDLESIVYGLDRVYNSVAQTGFSESEKANFQAALNNIDPVMRYSWQEILKA